MSEFIPRRDLQSKKTSLAAVGLETETPPLHRTPDGAIDVDYYLAKGRSERAKAAGRWVSKLFNAIRGRAKRENVSGPHTHYV